MADWYASSVAHAAVAQWAATTAYTVGQFVRALAAPSAGREYVFRCTVAGTSAASEPTWPTGDGTTVSSGGATFQNVTGRSAHGWSAAAGKLLTLTNTIVTRLTVGDRIFISSDSSETSTSTYAFVTDAWGLIQIISVNRAGSVPPVVADITPGATISNTAGNLTLNNQTNLYWEGITFSSATGATLGTIFFGNSAYRTHYLKNCAVVLPNTNASSRITANIAAEITFDNTTVQFGAAGQCIFSSAQHPFAFNWLNTPSAIAGATLPTSLFNVENSNAAIFATCRGVDLSAVTGTLLGIAANSGFGKVLLDSCKISSSATKLGTSGTSPASSVELVNCWDGSNVLNERYAHAGAVTTDRSTTMSGGAQDDVGNYSLKLVSNSNADKFAFPLEAFWFDIENTATGSSKTATVEIVSGGSLNNDDITLLLEYMGTSGNPLASFVSSLATVLTTASALSSSAVTWNNPPGSPQKQKLTAAFTPQRAGRVRGLVRLGKVSTTVWVNPQIAIT